MKNIFLTIVISATVLSVNAQFSLSSASENYINPCSEKITEINYTNNFGTGETHSSKIDKRSTEHFRKQFPSVNNPYWYKVNDGYIASFEKNSVETKVAYNAKGKLHHTISYYNEKKLPRDVWETVKSAYYAYDILRVAEVHFADKIIYMTYVQNEKSLKLVRVCDGEMEEVQSFKRG